MWTQSAHDGVFDGFGKLALPLLDSGFDAIKLPRHSEHTSGLLPDDTSSSK